MKFAKITRLNRKGEERDLVIDLDTITAIDTHKPEPIELFDSLGNLVETKEQPMCYVLYTTHTHYHISEDTYNSLVDTLVK